MAAGQGFKTFVTGEVLTAGDVNGYLMQGINVFTNATARDAAITAPAEGQFAFTKDNNSLWYYDGAAWVASGATGDIEGVTAGVGISGGGTSGTVTVTNSMATAIDAKGDLVPGTGADTFARLAIGANNTVLTADSAEATGMKWAAPGGAGANWTQINPSNEYPGSVSTFTISGISGADKIMIIALNVDSTNTNAEVKCFLNGDTTPGNYTNAGWQIYNSATYNVSYFDKINSNNGIRLGVLSNNSGSTLSGFAVITGCNASGRKVYQADGGVDPVGSANGVITSNGGAYSGSSTISSISLTLDTGTFVFGTRFLVFTSA